MTPNGDRSYLILVMLDEIMSAYIVQLVIALKVLMKNRERKRKRLEGTQTYSMILKIPDQVKHINRLVMLSDTDCISNLRMDRNAFGRLCSLLRHLGGLDDGRYVSLEEQVAIFVGVLAHHKKNSIVAFDFRRSGHTISTYVHKVLGAILKLHKFFLVKPSAIEDDCLDPRWRWFKGCLGALDGTYIQVQVPNSDKPRYRTRKGQICTNTLAVCDRMMRFIYVLPGWEGSAADGRVLRDAVNRINGLKVARGKYFLCDNGYANSDGFLTPFKGVRYHLKEWGPDTVKPQSPVEIFNMRHTRARNVIERAFGLVKMRWGILRSPSYYPIQIQTRLIMACFLLHNFIRGEMAVDPIEDMLDNMGEHLGDDEADEHTEFVDTVEPSSQWGQKRDEIAQWMWDAYQQE